MAAPTHSFATPATEAAAEEARQRQSDIVTKCEAQLVRIQRALAIVKRREQPVKRRESRATAETRLTPGPKQRTDLIGSDGDFRKISEYSFEQDAFLLAFETHVACNAEGVPASVFVGAATLETRALGRLSPGEAGSHYVEEIRGKISWAAHPYWWPGREAWTSERGSGMDEEGKGKLRQEIALLLEKPIPEQTTYMHAECVGGEDRKVIVLAWDVEKLHADLAVVGMDLKKQ